MFKKFFCWIGNFLYRALIEAIDKLDDLKPIIIAIIIEKISPEEMTDRIVDTIQRKLKKIIDKIFGKK